MATKMNNIFDDPSTYPSSRSTDGAPVPKNSMRSPTWDDDRSTGRRPNVRDNEMVEMRQTIQALVGAVQEMKNQPTSTVRTNGISNDDLVRMVRGIPFAQATPPVRPVPQKSRSLCTYCLSIMGLMGLVIAIWIMLIRWPQLASMPQFRICPAVHCECFHSANDHNTISRNELSAWIYITLKEVRTSHRTMSIDGDVDMLMSLLESQIKTPDDDGSTCGEDPGSQETAVLRYAKEVMAKWSGPGDSKPRLKS